MAPPSQETITILALDKHQQPVFRVKFIGRGFKLNLLDEAMTFGLHLLKLEPGVVLSLSRDIFEMKLLGFL